MGVRDFKRDQLRGLSAFFGSCRLIARRYGPRIMGHLDSFRCCWLLQWFWPQTFWILNPQGYCFALLNFRTWHLYQESQGPTEWQSNYFWLCSLLKKASFWPFLWSNFMLSFPNSRPIISALYQSLGSTWYLWSQKILYLMIGMGLAQADCPTPLNRYWTGRWRCHSIGLKIEDLWS